MCFFGRALDFIATQIWCLGLTKLPWSRTQGRRMPTPCIVLSFFDVCSTMRPFPETLWGQGLKLKSKTGSRLLRSMRSARRRRRKDPSLSCSPPAFCVLNVSLEIQEVINFPLSGSDWRNPGARSSLRMSHRQEIMNTRTYQLPEVKVLRGRHS